MHISVKIYTLAAIFALAFAEPSHAQLPATRILSRYVNAETGSDVNNGRAANPWQTLTHALTTARPCSSRILNIYVVYTARPIAETGFSDANPSLEGREPPGAFPLWIPWGVNVIGIPGPSGELPRILLNEEAGGPYTWPTSVHSLVMFAPDTSNESCALHGGTMSHMDLYGSKLRNKPFEDTLYGVYARDIEDFYLESCTISDFFHCVFVEETGINGDAARLTTSGNINHSLISGTFPLLDYANPPTTPDLLADRGHAGLWMYTSGAGASASNPAIVSITTIGTTYQNCHDGIEPFSHCDPAPPCGHEGEPPCEEPCGGVNEPPCPCGGMNEPQCPPICVPHTKFVLDAASCIFRCNANGIEMVTSNLGFSECDFSVSECQFLNNYNRRTCEGGYQDTDTAGIVHRGKDSMLTVRRCLFRNNAIGISIGEGAELNMGMFGDPGLNTFCLDTDSSGQFTGIAIPDVPGVVSPPQASIYPRHIVGLFVGGITTVDAYGNRWVPNSVDTDSNGNMLPAVFTASGEILGEYNMPLDTGLTGSPKRPPIYFNYLTSPRSVSIQNSLSKVIFGTATYTCGGTHSPSCCSATPATLPCGIEPGMTCP